MKIDDLLQITLDEAVELSKGQNGRSVVANWTDAHYMKDLENEYKKSCNPSIILKAVFTCAMNDFKLPKWLQRAYIDAYRKVRHYRAASWSAVFGRPHPKGTHLNAKRELRENKYNIYFLIEKIIESEPETPIDGYLFERVGRELGIGGKTKISDIYYEVKAEIENFSENF